MEYLSAELARVEAALGKADPLSPTRPTRSHLAALPPTERGRIVDYCEAVRREAARALHDRPALYASLVAEEEQLEEAVGKARELDDLSDPEVGRKRLSGRFGGHDFSHLPMDKPLSPEDFPDPDTVQAARSRTEVIVGLVRREKPTLRQLLSYLAGARGHYVTAGTPEQIADLIADWCAEGAADGFNVMPPVLPASLEVFASQVIPLLQRRGLFRTEYTAETLRGHYGLARPAVV